jgi:hypothetical protein
MTLNRCSPYLAYKARGLLLPNSFRGDFHIRDLVDPTRASRGHPMHGVSNHSLDFRLAIGRKRFVTGPKIEDFAVAPLPAAAGSEDFSPLEPGNKYGLVRSGNAERFAIHLLVGNFEVGLDSLSDWMARIADPKSLFFSGFAPDQGAGRTHQAFEDLGIVPGMKYEKPHSFQNPFLNPVDDFVRHLAMRNMPPPDQDVRVGKTGFRQSVFRLLERRRSDFEGPIDGQTIRDALMNALRVNLPNCFGPLFMDVFAPDHDSSLVH